jgi:tetratricopeptide (TPR) repeat protein
VRTLDSIAAQTWPALEIIVAAACGHAHRSLPDNHRGRPLRLVRAETKGVLRRPVAANLCMLAARGAWLNFLDDDDEFLPSHLETLIRAPRNAGERVVYSRTRVVDPQGQTIGHCGFAGFHAQLYYQSRSTPAGTLFQRSLVDEGARFDEQFDLLEDHDFFVNLATRSAFRFVDEVTGIWHAHAGESGAGFGHNYTPERLDPYYAKLREKWKSAFASWTSRTEALLFLGQHALRSGDHKAALDFLERALRLAPNDVNALNLCGMANFKAGELDRAEALFMQALRVLPTHTGIGGNLAMLREARRETKRE